MKTLWTRLQTKTTLVVVSLLVVGELLFLGISMFHKNVIVDITDGYIGTNRYEPSYRSTYKVVSEEYQKWEKSPIDKIPESLVGNEKVARKIRGKVPNERLVKYTELVKNRPYEISGTVYKRYRLQDIPNVMVVDMGNGMFATVYYLDDLPLATRGEGVSVVGYVTEVKEVEGKQSLVMFARYSHTY